MRKRSDSDDQRCSYICIEPIAPDFDLIAIADQYDYIGKNEMDQININNERKNYIKKYLKSLVIILHATPIKLILSS